VGFQSDADTVLANAEFVPVALDVVAHQEQLAAAVVAPQGLVGMADAGFVDEQFGVVHEVVQLPIVSNVQVGT
jgi:hypothetical protein